MVCELILTYELKLKDGASVTLRKPALDDILYDSAFDSVLLMIHDMHKRCIFFGDIYPKATKLEKGEYTIRVQVRHDSMDLLETLKTKCLYADIKLDSSVSLDFYSSLADLQNPSKKALSMKNGKLDVGEPRPLFVDCKTTAKDLKAGDILVGELSFGPKVEGGSIPALYVVPPEAKSKDSSDSSPDEKEPPSLETMANAVRDLKLEWIKKLTCAEEQTKLVEELQKNYPTHLGRCLDQCW